MRLFRSGIEKLDNLSSADAQRLRGQGIDSLDALWTAIGRNFDTGISDLAASTGIPPDRLLALITGLGVEEAKTSVGLSPKRLWLEGSIVLGVLLLVLLTLRSVGHNGWMPASLRLSSDVLAAARDLEPGHPLVPADYITARLPKDSHSLTITDTVEGLSVARAVQAGRPLRREDLLQYTLTAARDLPAETVITRDAVTMAWTAYEPDVALRVDRVLGHRLRHAVRKDQPIRVDFAPDLPPEKGRITLNLTCGPNAISPDVKPGSLVSLFLARKDGKSAAPFVVSGAKLLAVNRVGDANAVTVAVRPAEVKAIVTRLGACEVYVMPPMPPAGGK